METYDLVVVGTGSGLNVADAAASRGWRVAVVEKGPLGGTCLNRGCIPSKLIIHAADVLETVRRAKEYGITVGRVKVDFATIVRRASRYVDGESAHIRKAFDGLDNPRLHEGEARFTGDRTLRVGDETIRGRRVLLAHGCRPTIPDIDGLDQVPYMTSTEALRRTRQPRTMVIVGGGYIAAELAHFYGTLGTKVHIVQRHERLVRGEDEEVSAAYTRIARRRFKVHAPADVERVRRDGRETVVRIRPRAKGAATRTVRCDALLVAAGVTPNSDTLDLRNGGVETDGRGYVKVDDYLRTTAPGVFALGDCVGRFLLKHNANHESSYAAHNMLNPDDMVPVDYSAMPHAIFSSPQIAGVGATEQSLRERGVEYDVARHEYKGTAMGKALHEEDGFVKFLVDKDRKILGCHIIGPQAADLIHEVVVAMAYGGGTIDAVAGTVHVHPALSEVVQRAAGSI